MAKPILAKKNYPKVILISVISLWLLSWLFTYIGFDSWGARGTFGDMFGSVNSLFSGLAFVGIVYTIFLQVEAVRKDVEAVRKDHERRMKEVTILYMNQIRPTYRALLSEFDDFNGKERLTASMLKEILDEKNEDKRNTLREYLATLEHLAVGANSGVFDKDLLFRMSASYIIRTYDRFAPYILHAQKGKHRASIYTEFEDLAEEFKAKRNKNTESTRGGDIKPL